MPRFVPLIALASFAVAVPLAAQAPLPDHLSGARDLASVAAGTYTVEPSHTQIAFAVSHMGISPFAGWFSGTSGTLTLDPADPAKASLTVEVPVASVQTTSGKLTDELKSADWFDAAQFPKARFESTRVTPIGKDAAEIAGNLTLHGVTRPVLLRARLFGATANPMSHAPSLGFIGKIMLRRSEFGVTKYATLVSDEVELVINAAFEKAGQPHGKN